MEKYLIEVDSGERNVQLWPNSNSYQVTLSRPLYNVSNIKLVAGRIPLTQYTIDNHNNKMFIDGTEYTLTPNNYATGAELAAGVTNDLILSNVVAQFNESQNKLVFSNTSAFSMEFKSRSPASVLGFVPRMYAGTDVIAPGTIDIDGPTSIILAISSVNDDSFYNEVFLDKNEESLTKGYVSLQTSTGYAIYTINSGTSNTLGSYYTFNSSNVIYISTSSPFTNGDNVKCTFSLTNTNEPIVTYYDFDDGSADPNGIASGEFRVNNITQDQATELYFNFTDQNSLNPKLQDVNTRKNVPPIHYYGRILTTDYTATAASGGTPSLATIGGSNVLVTGTSGFGAGLGKSIIDFNGHDDPIRHNFYTGNVNYISNLKIDFYLNNFNELVPYDFKLRNHILKFEITCSLDKLIITKENENVKKMIELPPKLDLGRFRDPWRPLGDKRFLMYGGAIILFIIVLILVSSSKHVQLQK